MKNMDRVGGDRHADYLDNEDERDDGQERPVGAGIRESVGDAAEGAATGACGAWPSRQSMVMSGMMASHATTRRRRQAPGRTPVYDASDG